MSLTNTPRPNWNKAFGPLDLTLPDDPDPWPGFDWGAAYFMGQAHDHQDSQDRLNADRTWGTNDTQAPGGSGIALAYSQPDLGAVRVAFQGWKNNPVKPNVEHACRDGLYDLAGFEMTHEPQFARGVQSVALRCTTWPWFEYDGPVVLDDPSNRPQNLDCLLAQVEANPRRGIQYLNLRALAWAMYFKAAEHKCARVLGAPVSALWMEKVLDILELAAVPGTGQIGSGPGDQAHPLDQPNCEYTFHWGLAAIGAMACAKRCLRPIPSWVIPHLDALDALGPMLYQPYGAVSLPSFTYTEEGVLHFATGAGQNGDPAFGWWSSACVAVATMRPDERDAWLARATHWGPSTWDGHDEQTRKFTMLLRGAAAKGGSA